MRVSDVETNTAGEVTGYSCPECGSALELCHDLDYEREHGPHQTEARFACVDCNSETETPDPDEERSGERLYSVRVEVMWNSPGSMGGTLCESEELVSFESERDARAFMNGLFQAEFNKGHEDVPQDPDDDGEDELVSSQNTPKARVVVEVAARHRFPGDSPQCDFEHGQWWVTIPTTGAAYSVIDCWSEAKGNHLDFEQVSDPDYDED